MCGWVDGRGRSHPHSGFDVSNPSKGEKFILEPWFVRPTGILFFGGLGWRGQGALGLADALAGANQVSGRRRVI
jgi:hypothetical protein